MKKEDIAATRTQLCRLVGAIGDIAGSLQALDCILDSETSPEVLPLILSQHVEEAAADADRLAAHADELSKLLDRYHVTTRATASALVSDESPLPASH